MNAQNRRDFLRKSSLFAGALALPSPWSLFASGSSSLYIPNTRRRRIAFYHSSDLQGQLEGNEMGFGGLKAINRSLGKERHQPLLLDAGDFLSPQQDPEAHKNFLLLMKETGYTCAGIGRNELAHGEAYLASLLPQLNFPLVNCNYGFSDEKLSSAVREYVIVQWGNQHIGITGVGPQIEGIAFKDPQEAATAVAKRLREQEKVELVLCLSHLDHEHPSLNNRSFAQGSEDLDFIIGGHSKYYRLGNLSLKNAAGRDVLLCEGGPGGSLLGKVDLDQTEGGLLYISGVTQQVPGLADPSQLARTIDTLNRQIV